MADAAKPKLQQKTDVSDVLTEAVRARQTESKAAKTEVSADPRFANISATASSR